MIRNYSRYSSYVPRKKLRAMSVGESLIIRGLPLGAVKSARVTCSAVGKERGCCYSLSVEETTPGEYNVTITRMTRQEAAERGLLRATPNIHDNGTR